jgi:uncharacterized ion transporter superfamily protein YfcC
MKLKREALCLSVVVLAVLASSAAVFGICETCCCSGLCIPVQNDWGFDSCSEVADCFWITRHGITRFICFETCDLGDPCPIPPPPP